MSDDSLGYLIMAVADKLEVLEISFNGMMSDEGNNLKNERTRDR